MFDCSVKRVTASGVGPESAATSVIEKSEVTGFAARKRRLPWKGSETFETVLNLVCKRQRSQDPPVRTVSDFIEKTWKDRTAPSA